LNTCLRLTSFVGSLVQRGWLAIDPKGLLGERGFDYANIFCNPDLNIARSGGRLSRQTHIVAKEANLDRSRLLQWILAYAGLSAAWHLEDGNEKQAALTLEVAQITRSELEL
jgi:streptomycin 6-kinase